MITINLHKNQTGMVLLLCLIFLTALTMLGLSAAADTVLQNKLSANFQDTERARQSAQSTLSRAEQWLFKLEGTAPEYCSEPCTGLRIHATGSMPDRPEFENISWWIDHGYKTGADPLSESPKPAPELGKTNTGYWVIEALHIEPPAGIDAKYKQVWYRILSRGRGQAGTAVSVAESTVVRSWPANDSFEPPNAQVSNSCLDTESVLHCERVSWRELR